MQIFNARSSDVNRQISGINLLRGFIPRELRQREIAAVTAHIEAGLRAREFARQQRLRGGVGK